MQHHHMLKISSSHHLYTICVVGFIFTLHATLPTYVNSTFLNQFTTENTVSILYILSSVVTIITFLSFHHILNRYGNYKTTMFFIATQVVLLTGLAFGKSIFIISPFFILSLVVASALALNLDIFLEDSTSVKETGGVRGIYLTSVNIAWVISPLFVGALLDSGTNYRFIYMGALVLIFPFAYIVKKNFKHFKDPQYSHATLKATAHKVFHTKDLKKIFIANIILQSFYAWMVIYTPIYLHKYIGFAWDEIGIIFTIMLLPFVLLDYPLGKLADKKYGEKEIMTAGFLILGISTLLLSYIENKSIFVWAFALFVTRVGAATVEMMIETYFFKKVPEKDLDVLGFFRITRPLAYIVSPLLAALCLDFLGYPFMYTILGIMCLIGLYFSLTIRDTN